MNYILKGTKPVIIHDIENWRATMANNNRVVRATQIKSYNVSTVFLGLDHNYDPTSGNPILFETLVFGPEGAKWTDHMERYDTWDNALKGHNNLVRLIMNLEIVKEHKLPTTLNLRK